MDAQDGRSPTPAAVEPAAASPRSDFERDLLAAITLVEAQIARVKDLWASQLESAGAAGAEARLAELEEQRRSLGLALDSVTRESAKGPAPASRESDEAVAGLVEEIETLRRKVEEAGSAGEEERERLRRQRDALARELSERDRAIERLNERCAAVAGEADTAMARAGAQERRIRELESRLAQREAGLGHERAAIEEEWGRIRAAGAELSAAAARLEELRCDLDVRESELSGRAAELDTRETDLERHGAALERGGSVTGISDPAAGLVLGVGRGDSFGWWAPQRRGGRRRRSAR